MGQLVLLPTSLHHTGGTCPVKLFSDPPTEMPALLGCQGGDRFFNLPGHTWGYQTCFPRERAIHGRRQQKGLCEESDDTGTWSSGLQWVNIREGYSHYWKGWEAHSPRRRESGKKSEQCGRCRCGSLSWWGGGWSRNIKAVEGPKRQAGVRVGGHTQIVGHGHSGVPPRGTWTAFARGTRPGG